MDARELIARALEVVGGNQAELARRLGRSETTVSRWVTGRNGIDFESALRLARLTSLPTRQVLEACGLDPDLVPPLASDERADAIAPELDAHLTRFGARLSRYPRAVWLAWVEANEKMADAFGMIETPEPPISAPPEGPFSDPDRALNRGKRGRGNHLTVRSAGFGLTAA